MIRYYVFHQHWFSKIILTSQNNYSVSVLNPFPLPESIRHILRQNGSLHKFVDIIGQAQFRDLHVLSLAVIANLLTDDKCIQVCKPLIMYNFDWSLCLNGRACSVSYISSPIESFIRTIKLTNKLMQTREIHQLGVEEERSSLVGQLKKDKELTMVSDRWLYVFDTLRSKIYSWYRKCL